MFDLQKLSERELLKLSDNIIDELKRRRVVTTNNKPISDYAKWLAREALNLTEVKKSVMKCDGIDEEGKCYLVRSRQNTRDSSTVVFSVIRDTLMYEIDYVVAIVFDCGYKVEEAYLVPSHELNRVVNFSKHQNGYILNSAYLQLNEGVQWIKNKFDELD